MVHQIVIGGNRHRLVHGGRKGEDCWSRTLCGDASPRSVPCYKTGWRQPRKEKNDLLQRGEDSTTHDLRRVTPVEGYINTLEVVGDCALAPWTGSSVYSTLVFFLCIDDSLLPLNRVDRPCRQQVCVYVRTFTLLITHAITDTKVMLSEPDVGYLYTPLRVDHAMG